MKLKNPMPLLLEDNDIVRINKENYIVNSVSYDEHGLTTHIHATKVNIVPAYDLSGLFEKEPKDTSVIPVGQYCYGITVQQWMDQWNHKDHNINITGKQQRRCPYWSSNSSKPYQMNGHCSFVNEGDWEDESSGLLWDQVKSCGIFEDFCECCGKVTDDLDFVEIPTECNHGQLLCEQCKPKEII